MPKVSWDEINDLIHSTKNTLTKVVGVELRCRNVKKEITKIESSCKGIKEKALGEIDKIHKIILKQVNNNHK